MISGIGSQLQKQQPAFIQSEFSKYGITPTGDKEADMEALKEAKIANGEDTSQIEAFESQMQQMEQMQAQNGQGAEGQKPPMGGGEPPWASLMSSLGLEGQGSKEEDMAAIYEKLTEMQSSAAGSADQQSNLNTMLAQYEYYNSQSSSMMG